MKSLFLFLITVLFINISKASNYYFSGKLGNDDRTPQQAQNPSTPWKTLGKLNAFFSSLRPGDSVLLRRGETFYGSITVNKSGTSASPIVIGAYGAGNKPVITSLVTLTGWTANQTYKGVFESSANSSLGASVNMLLINRAVQQLGRYPNSDAANKGYLILESHDGKASITDNELSSPVNWTGAELVLRSRRWVLDRNLITSQSGNTIFYSASSKYEPNNKFGYFIQSDIKTLDKFGEWYYNPAEKKLSIYFGENTPSRYTIEASTIDNLISSSGISHVVFDNINVTGANVCGFNINNGTNIKIKNCDILFSGQDGVKVSNHKKFDIENCTVYNSNNNGINLGYSGSYATIKNNKIVNTSVLAGMGGSGDGKGMAILSNGKGTVIENNKILNTGYTALYFNGDSTIVKNNFIDSFCLIKDDGSAIYTYTGYSKNNTFNKGRAVIGNIVMNGIDSKTGTNSKSPASHGIYIDVGATGVEITGNTVVNTSNGIFFHNAHHLIVKNNTLYGNDVGLYMGHNGKSHAITDNIITNNVFFSKEPKQLAISILTTSDYIDNIGILDSNFYFGPDGGDLPFKQVFKKNSGKNTTKRQDLNDWKNTHRYDISSRKLPMQLFNNKNADDVIRFEFNPSGTNKIVKLGASYKDVNDNPYSNRIVLKPYSSILLLKQPGKKTR